MQELDDEYCEVLESVRIDCHRHGLNAGLGRQLDLDTNDVSRNFQKKQLFGKQVDIWTFIKVKPSWKFS